MGDDPVYVKSTCFDPFPFPADVPKPLQGNIRDQAEALDALRKRVLESHQDLTLTRLYNVLEALKEGRSLTEAERDIPDRGLDRQSTRLNSSHYCASTMPTSACIKTHSERLATHINHDAT